MAITLPKTSSVLAALLKADYLVLWRNRRASLMALLMPLIIVFFWKGAMPGAYILANAITLGIISIGLMGYANAIARDRDKGVFQRLRVSPLPLWTIMASRLLVQLSLILLLTVLAFIAGYKFDGIEMPATNYIITFFISLIGGALCLSLGQAIVGLIKTPETVNSTTRLVYLLFIMTGMLGQFNFFGHEFKVIVEWAPYGTLKTILAAGLDPGRWDNHVSESLLLAIGYTVIFSIIGIKWFKWSVK